MVSIIILSYNTQELLRNCLNSLFSHTPKEDIEVIVVDNASKDESVAMVKKEFSKVVVIENKENVGFSRGCNIGAQKANGEYLLFLNSDTEFTADDTLSLMREAMTEKVGAVGGLMKNEDGSLQRSFGSFYTLAKVSKMIFLGERGELSGVNVNKKQEVDWVSGGFMMVQRSVFESAGRFDEKIFMYVEDVELCYRIKKAGYKVIMNPEAKVKHVGHGSSNRTFAIVQIYKGLSYFYKKHKSGVEYFSLQIILRLKAYISVIFGTMVRKPELVARYKQALASL
jgi:GT2 family glycosyltransferase